MFKWLEKKCLSSSKLNILKYNYYIRVKLRVILTLNVRRSMFRIKPLTKNARTPSPPSITTPSTLTRSRTPDWSNFSKYICFTLQRLLRKKTHIFWGSNLWQYAGTPLKSHPQFDTYKKTQCSLFWLCIATIALLHCRHISYFNWSKSNSASTSYLIIKVPSTVPFTGISKLCSIFDWNLFSLVTHFWILTLHMSVCNWIS